jgi:hypothetical protein
VFSIIVRVEKDWLAESIGFEPVVAI